MRTKIKEIKNVDNPMLRMCTNPQEQRKYAYDDNSRFSEDHPL